MISVNNLSFKYKNGNQVLNDLNFCIKDGEFISIIGKNGSGKSTLGRLVAGLVKPTKGSIIIDDLNTSDKNNFIKIREKVGIVFQNPENQLLFNNVYDELAFGLKNLGRNDIDERIEKSLAMVNMSQYIRAEIYEMSLGQKQRIAIAEALSISPKYIIFDEPTTMLDSKGKDDVYSIVKSLKQLGYTIIYITNMAEEILMADRIFLLDNKEIATELSKEGLLENIELLNEYEVKIPTVINLISELRNNGINIDSSSFEVKDIVKQILERINVK